MEVAEAVASVADAGAATIAENPGIWPEIVAMNHPVVVVVDAVVDSEVAPTTALATSVNNRVTSLAIVPMSRLVVCKPSQRRSLKKNSIIFLNFQFAIKRNGPCRSCAMKEHHITALEWVFARRISFLFGSRHRSRRFLLSIFVLFDF